ncbi:MAG: nucleotide sugar dehydrogenase [Actinomycetota bacterium]
MVSRVEPSTRDRLVERIRDHSAVVGVVGLGYVGLPFAVEKAKVGFHVIGVDQNPERAERVRRGENFIGDVSDAELGDLVRDGLIESTDAFDRVAEMDVVVICVPTPLTKHLTPDLSHVESVTREIAAALRPGQLVSLESTTYPGTTDELMLPILAASGLEVERDFFLAHSPERVDPGNRRYTTKNTSKVVGGVGPVSLEVAVEFYGQTIQDVVAVSSAKAAELVKVFENTYRAVNIALVNELALLCDRMGLNVWEVLDAAFTKPYGIQPFYPGPGVGGHCIPIDPHYLEWKARELNFSTHFIALAGEVNRSMPSFVVEKAHRILNRLGVSPSNAKVLVIGITYKADVADHRESPAIEILRLLRRDGAEVTFHDPYVPQFRDDDGAWKSVELTDDVLERQDLVIVASAHSGIDYERVVGAARHVLDTRNATKDVAAWRDKITLL